MPAGDTSDHRSPSVAEVELIGGDPDPVARNLRITQAYHELSGELGGWLGHAANWCTFATWASRQAGQTIRREDVARTLEAELGGAEEIGRAVTRVSEVVRAVGRRADRGLVLATVRDVLSPVRAAERASEAVARGNKKVFDEIGHAFSRLVGALRDGDGAAIARVRTSLRPGPPPDGQGLLRAAFDDYARASTAADRRAQSEWLLLANLRIGWHEQTRLQPEIADALNAPVAAPREVKARLLARLFPASAARLAAGLVRRLHDSGPLEGAVQELVDAVRRRVRRVLTEHFMTLDLSGRRVRLGADVAGLCPPHLLDPVDPDLRALLGSIDPVPSGSAGSGAIDWADLGQRMHFICELFRAHQDDTSLFSPPFTPEQAAAIRQGRAPAGRL